jgi:hypothetical protein
MHQSTIAKIENVDGKQKPRDVTLDEAVGLAAALRVAPVNLFVPLDDNELIRVGKRPELAFVVRGWMRGANKLDHVHFSLDDEMFFYAERPHGERAAERVPAYGMASALRELIQAFSSGELREGAATPREYLEGLAEQLLLEVRRMMRQKKGGQ